MKTIVYSWSFIGWKFASKNSCSFVGNVGSLRVTAVDQLPYTLYKKGKASIASTILQVLSVMIKTQETFFNE